MVQVHLGPRTRLEEVSMKRAIALLLLAVAGYAVYQQMAASKDEQDLWEHATAE